MAMMTAMWPTTQQCIWEGGGHHFAGEVGGVNALWHRCRCVTLDWAEPKKGDAMMWESNGDNNQQRETAPLAMPVHEAPSVATDQCSATEQCLKNRILLVALKNTISIKIGKGTRQPSINEGHFSFLGDVNFGMDHWALKKISVAAPCRGSLLFLFYKISKKNSCQKKYRGVRLG